MNNMLKKFCASLASLGVLVLGISLYFSLVYGHGEMEAGNFNHCHYWTDRDSFTGQLRHHWEKHMTHFGRGIAAIVENLDMWTVGGVLLAVGAGLCVGDWSRRHPLWPA